MTLTAQIIGIFAMAANVAAYQFKNRRNVILCQLAGAVLIFALNAKPILSGAVRVLKKVKRYDDRKSHWF